MSIVSLSTGEPTVTSDDLAALCKTNNFGIEKGSAQEAAYLLFANSFDATCKTIHDLPEYHDPRLAPIAVEGGKRTFHRLDEGDNPLNGWAHKTSLKSADHAARNGALAGRTIAFKDNVSIARLPLGLGCSPRHFEGGRHPISTIDASVVARSLAAGATVKGTATCENFSMFAVSFTSDSGVVHNAWLPGYATGGSSSGCGALVSIRDVEQARESGRDTRDYPLGEGVDMAIGGDQGGSIRLPASYSGIYGLKPTHGLVPYTGIASLNPMIDHAGPMARTVDDIALLLGVVAGYDGMDMRMTPESPLRHQVPDYFADLQAWVAEKHAANEWDSHQSANGLRFGMIRESFEMPGLDPDVTRTVREAARRFAALGADVKDVSIPMHSLGAAIWTVAARPAMPHNLANHAPDLLAHPLPGLDPLPVDQGFFDILIKRNPAVINVLLNTAHMRRKYGPALARKAMMHVHQLRAAYDEALKEFDVLITPVNPTVGPAHPPSTLRRDENADGSAENMMDLFERVIGSTLNTSPFNCTGHPAMSVGWGLTKDGRGKLPVGMQLVAKRWDEGSILKAAKAWEMGGRWQDHAIGTEVGGEAKL
ncbi:Putative amidase [Septoria linicola]|uniref:Amidase n=1 Tax=Septoria linicola TaxID=215465 RepID=A0A9Q9EIY8_9PEZI|nr:putative amidase [Septoria linicola]USW53266.1 Putative amidase [Septoria linicola]